MTTRYTKKKREKKNDKETFNKEKKGEKQKPYQISTFQFEVD